MAEVYPRPPMTFRQKIENFWYHHKWVTITSSFFVAFVLIATVQFILKKDADVSILYVGCVPVSENTCDAISESAQSFIFDVNGDDTVFAEVRTIVLPSDLDLLNEGQKIQAMGQYRTYSDEILGGDSCILILDEYFYKELADSGALVNLYEVFTEPPSAAFDFYGLRLGETPLYRLDGFSQLPKDAVLCLKHSSPVSNLDEKDRLETDARNIELFRAFYEGKKSGSK